MKKVLIILFVLLLSVFIVNFDNQNVFNQASITVADGEPACC